MLSRASRAACRLHAASSVRLAARATHSSAPRPSAAAAAVASSPTASASSWAAATESAHSVLVPPPVASSSKAGRRADFDDPLAAITAEIGELKHSLYHMLGSSHPSLDSVAKYYFNAEGKHLRPLLVLLISQATNGIAGDGWAQSLAKARQQVLTRTGGVDDSLTSQGGVLNDWNPESMGPELGGEMVFAQPYRIPPAGSRPPPPITPSPFADILATGGPDSPTILPTQRRLASIVEMIHVASLLHDDVIDASSLRRGEPSAPASFGNKLSILSGDFLLGRASVALSRLGSTEVVELMATTVANLVEGEVIQLRATARPATEPTTAGFEEYMRKTYLKTASLMAKSARSAVVLGGCGSDSSLDTVWVKDVAYGFGRNLGIAFQLVDDMLDYSSTVDLGKPGSGADMRLGLATAPALFAWEEHPSLGPLIARKFSEPGDTEIALDLVNRSRGMERTAELARNFAGEARRLIELLPQSPARDALVGLTVKVVDRVK
ncbi:coq1 putative hexaprenyl diphosphate synthase [Vanrija albida]|uniref:(2E,6E)-farnesyl diphosphate synthase n=1 Tax=Vanrija albida TaxID=181172 RepID=A0ABR3QCU9_9TREE